MSKAIENLQAAQRRALAGRPKVGGFPFLAETLRRAGVIRNLWFLPSCQSLYVTEHGTVVTLEKPLASGTATAVSVLGVHDVDGPATRPGGGRVDAL